MSKTPWVFRLPPGLREQPAWVFIGTFVALAGLGYLLGISDSSTVTRVVTETVLRVWGGVLFVAGLLVIYSTIRANKPLEKLALRVQSISLLLYMGWIVTAIPVSKATLTVALCICLAGLSEIRIAVIKVLLRPLPPHAQEVGQ